jgi:uncharacterized protein YndB with AHSA1/START domain
MTAAIVHGQFSIDRTYSATPERVYAAWSELGAKAQWFIGPNTWRQTRRELDFRVGGMEVLEGAFGEDRTTAYHARFHHLVPGQRIVFDYDMYLGKVFHSVSLATVELTPTSSGCTQLRFTEQVAFLDGTTSASPREEGTATHLDRLGDYLKRGAGR